MKWRCPPSTRPAGPSAGRPIPEEVDRLTEAYAKREMELQRCSARAARLQRRSEQAAARSKWVVIGWIFGLLASHLAGQFTKRSARGAQLNAALRDEAAR